MLDLTKVIDVIIIGASKEGINTAIQLAKKDSNINIVIVSKDFNKWTSKYPQFPNIHRIEQEAFYTTFNRGLYGVYLKDTQTGLRAIPNHLIDIHLSTHGERFEYEINALIDLVKSYEKILQIDIKTVYLEDSNKNSHFNPIKDSYKIYKILFKRRKNN